MTLMQAFLGAPPGRIAINVVYSSNTNSPTVTINSLAGYTSGLTDVTITVNSGVVLYGDRTVSGSAGLTITGTAAAGDTIKLVNNGRIVGYGGDGALGGQVGPDGSVSPGPTGPYQAGNGGDALKIVKTNIAPTISVTNNGTIAGGGGGGGGGGGYYTPGGPYGHGGGGGGGQGFSGGYADPLGGSYNPLGSISNGSAGTSGSDAGAGSGGGGASNAGSGASGGAYGASGGTGADSNQSNVFYKGYGSLGGVAGAYVNGSAKVSFAVSGTLSGRNIS